MFTKGQRLFIILGGIFITNALIAEFIGVKIFSIEQTLGLAPFNWSLMGIEGSLSFTAGVMLWPFVFILSDIVNEYFGKKGVRLLSYLTAALLAYAFLMVYGAISLSPAGWWVASKADSGVPDMQMAFAGIFGQGNWIIIGSLTAFLIGQIIDVSVFHFLRKYTGSSRIWVRATGSTLVSQLIDSFVVLYIAFVLPGAWSFNQFLAIGIVNYVYKVTAAVVLTPLLYVIHGIIDRYLGKELSEEMIREAAASRV
ncbi:MAG: VUT family protein [Bacteroidetes bacterium]|nr:MAG: VUT family protein [Bacteroidota bacterium]